VHAGIEPRAGLAQLWAPGGVQPQLHPQDEVVAQLAGMGQALVDHPLQPDGGGRRLVGAGGAEVAGGLVAVLERLGQQGVAGLEVVVQQRGGDAGGHGDPRHARLVEPVAGDQPHGGLEDARPGVLPHARNAIRSAQ
jgi:hypothetical protein